MHPKPTVDLAKRRDERIQEPRLVDDDTPGDHDIGADRPPPSQLADIGGEGFRAVVDDAAGERRAGIGGGENCRGRAGPSCPRWGRR